MLKSTRCVSWYLLYLLLPCVNLAKFVLANIKSILNIQNFCFVSINLDHILSKAAKCFRG